MFNYNQYIHFLKHMKEMDKYKVDKIMSGFLKSTDFAGALFVPPDSANISDMVSEIYKLTAKPRVIKTLIRVADEEKLDRWAAVYYYSIANFNIDALHEAVDATAKDYEDGDITKSEYKRQSENNDEYLKLLYKLNKKADSIIKRDAKIIARKSGAPLELTKYALKTVPNSWLVPKNRVGYYINNVLTEIYSEESDGIDQTDWNEFFKYVFGKENTLDVAIIILSEGAERMSGFKGVNIRNTWDSLTAFALNALEKSDGIARGQMIEIYIKRLAKMFANGSYDLRVDLTTLSESEFPNLTKTIERYASQIKEAFKTKKTENA